jgi:hypothetical protein
LSSALSTATASRMLTLLGFLLAHVLEGEDTILQDSIDWAGVQRNRSHRFPFYFLQKGHVRPNSRGDRPKSTNPRTLLLRSVPLLPHLMTVSATESIGTSIHILPLPELSRMVLKVDYLIHTLPSAKRCEMSNFQFSGLFLMRNEFNRPSSVSGQDILQSGG